MTNKKIMCMEKWHLENFEFGDTEFIDLQFAFKKTLVASVFTPRVHIP